MNQVVRTTLPDMRKVSQAYKLLRTLKKPRIKRIMQIVHENPGLTQRDIWIKMRDPLQEQSTNDLTDLKRLGLIKTTRNGKWKHCRLSYNRLDEINRALSKFNNQKQ